MHRQAPSFTSHSHRRSGSAGVKGGVDILDARSGALRLRIFLPQQLMTDVDGLHGCFSCDGRDGSGFSRSLHRTAPHNMRPFPLSSWRVSARKSAAFPHSPFRIGGTTVTIEERFQSATAVSISGSLQVSPSRVPNADRCHSSLLAGPQRITIPSGRRNHLHLEAALTANCSDSRELLPDIPNFFPSRSSI